MAALSGVRGKITIGDTDAVVAEVTQWSIDEKANTVDDTAMNPDWDPDTDGAMPTSLLVTTSAITGKLTCNYKPTDTNGQLKLKPGLTMPYKLYPESDGTGKSYIEGILVVTGRSRSAQVSGKIEASFDFAIRGQMSESVVA